VKTIDWLARLTRWPIVRIDEQDEVNVFSVLDHAISRRRQDG
jgi:hypothetical protein